MISKIESYDFLETDVHIYLYFCDFFTSFKIILTDVNLNAITEL